MAVSFVATHFSPPFLCLVCVSWRRCVRENRIALFCSALHVVSCVSFLCFAPFFHAWRLISGATSLPNASPLSAQLSPRSSHLALFSVLRGAPMRSARLCARRSRGKGWRFWERSCYAMALSSWTWMWVSSRRAFCENLRRFYFLRFLHELSCFCGLGVIFLQRCSLPGNRRVECDTPSW